MFGAVFGDSHGSGDSAAGAFDWSSPSRTRPNSAPDSVGIPDPRRLSRVARPGPGFRGCPRFAPDSPPRFSARFTRFVPDSPDSPPAAIRWVSSIPFGGCPRFTHPRPCRPRALWFRQRPRLPARWPQSAETVERRCIGASSFDPAADVCSRTAALHIVVLQACTGWCMLQ